MSVTGGSPQQRLIRQRLLARQQPLTRQQRQSLDRARFQARHPYGAVAITIGLYLVILGFDVGELIYGTRLGIAFWLYALLGLAVAEGLALLAARLGPRARRQVRTGIAVLTTLALIFLRIGFPRPPFDAAQVILGVDLHAAFLGYLLVMIVMSVPRFRPMVARARTRKLLGPAGHAREGGYPARVRLLDGKSRRTWRYGAIRIGDGAITWHSADGSLALPLTSACQTIAVQSNPSGLFNRRTTPIECDGTRVRIDLPRHVLAALARGVG